MADEQTPVEVPVVLDDDTVKPLMPDIAPSLRGRICADNHERIGHHEKFCPLCIARKLAIKLMTERDALAQHSMMLIERLEMLAGERTMLTNKMFEMRQTMIEEGHFQ